MRCPSHFFHSWMSWEEYTDLVRKVTYDREGTKIISEGVQNQLWQRRKCLYCSFSQHRLIKDTHAVEIKP